jgi:hypothetical protein
MELSLIAPDASCSPREPVILDNKLLANQSKARMSLEGSIIPVVEGMFKEGLALHRTAPGVDAALPATTAAWAVLGAAPVVSNPQPYPRRGDGSQD